MDGRLKIDDHPRYNFDLNLPDSLRTEESVGDALKNLQNPKSKLSEYFFWFDISDTIDEEVFEHLQYGDTTSCYNAAQIWKKYSDTENSIGLTYKKNLAILYCLCIFDEENGSFLSESISIWNELVNSDKFWILFEKKYEISNGSGIHENVMNNFRENVVLDISEVYYDMYLQYNDVKYVKEFHNAFGVLLGKRVEKHLFDPIRQSIYEVIEDLNNNNNDDDDDDDKPTDQNTKCDNCEKVTKRIPESHFNYKDGSILCKECHTINGSQWQKRINDIETVEGSSKILRRTQKAIVELESHLEQLQKIGLYNHNQSKVIRDDVAETIRGASITIHNKTHMRQESLKMLDLAKKISCTADTKERLETESQIMNRNITYDKEGALVIEIGRFKKNKLVVMSNRMEYQTSKIYYEDVNSIVYYWIEDSDSTFIITTSKDTIRLRISRSSSRALYSVIKSFVEPLLVEKLVKTIFKKQGNICIGGVRFDKTGYHRSRILRSDQSVLWNDILYIPRIFDGKVFLYTGNNKSAEKFTAVQVSEPNAIIIPKLVEACYNEFKLHSQG